MKTTMCPGLVSVTFRKLTVPEIVKLAAGAGLECIEWGGDIHVPHGNIQAAAEAAKITVDSGLRVSAYGSYLRLGQIDGPSLEDVVETASVLGAPTIRVWAGVAGSVDSDSSTRRSVVSAALHLADLAMAAGLSISYEYHGNTLTDSMESTAQLLEETQHPAIFASWQPSVGWSLEKCQESLRSVLPRLKNVHAFHWWPDAGTRLSLAEGRDRWLAYVGTIRSAGLSPDVLLEFVRGDDPTLLAGEAQTLREILEAA